MSRRRGRGRSARPSRAPAEPAPIPAAFLERMEAMLGEASVGFLAALEAPPAGLRVNTLRLSPDRFRSVAPFPLEPAPFPPEGFLLPEEIRAGAHPYHAAGLYYLQDPGAMVVGALPPLPPAPRVLDLAAAPGGKATHLAARMAGEGVLVANDVHAGRARELAGNLERFGVRNAVVTADAPDRLAARWGAWFDLVVLDAPCSGESMFHKSDAARREWSPSSVLGCSRRQGEILRDAVRLLRPGGMLLYSTCTFSPEENEQVLSALLGEAPELEMASLPAVPGADSGRPEWADADGAGAADPAVARAMRLWPHRYPGAGHFIAALRRRREPGGSPQEDSRHAAGPSSPPLPAGALESLRAFVASELARDVVPSGVLVAQGEELYLLPEEVPPLDGIRVLRPGWWLGSAKKGRFEPSHTLALAITPEDAARVRDLSGEGAEVAAYLRGESLPDAGESGWVLVTVDGFPLGWGKRSGGVLKNHYPRGLRRR